MTESQLDLGKQLKSKIKTLHENLSVIDTLERGDPSKYYVVVTDYINGSVSPRVFKVKGY